MKQALAASLLIAAMSSLATGQATLPTVSITSPTSGQMVSGITSVFADASDNAIGVQFKVDGVNIGREVQTPPYSVSWDTTTLTQGPHTLTAVVRDAAGNVASSDPVTVTVLNDPSQIGQWVGPLSWPLVAVHMTLLPTGKVLAWDDDTNDPGTQLWDPASGALTPVPNVADNLFCSGHTALADGKILVTGGTIAIPDVGTPDVNVFDPETASWASVQPMAFGRWYPTAITLPDGRVLAVSGHTTCDVCVADIPEVYDPATNTWSQLPTARSSIPTTYPHLFVLPDGRVLEVGSSEEVIPTRVLDVGSQTWRTVDPNAIDGGSSVMYEPGKVMKSGGAWDDGVGTPSVNSYVLDITQPSPAWRQTAPMGFARVVHNLTLLADGNVLVTGGSSDSDFSGPGSAVYNAELWSPTTETWTTMANMQVPRVYHSTALLLPDGRILVAGGGRFGGTDQLSAEIYSPPYLFKGARPTITAAPTRVSYGSNFSVATPQPSRIVAVSLVRPGSVTHAFNSNQRFLKLNFQHVSGGLNVQAPANANLAPPGYYMLFLIDANGVPSVASFLRLP